MGWLARVLSAFRVRAAAPDPDKQRVSEQLDATEIRQARVIRKFRQADDAHRKAAARARQAAERVIDEVEDA